MRLIRICISIFYFLLQVPQSFVRVNALNGQTLAKAYIGLSCFFASCILFSLTLLRHPKPFSHFFSVHVGSSLLCWQWIYTVRYWTFFFFLPFFFIKDSVITSSSSINQYGPFDQKLSSRNKHTNTPMKTSPFMSCFQRRLPIDIWDLRRSCHGWQELCASWLSDDVPKKDRTPARMRTDRGLPYKDLFESRELGPS